MHKAAEGGDFTMAGWLQEDIIEATYFSPFDDTHVAINLNPI